MEKGFYRVRRSVGTLVITLCLGQSAAFASTVPEGMTKIDFSAGQASSSEMWYTTKTGADFTRSLRSGENFRDRQFDLTVSRGIDEHTEVGLGLGLADKSHFFADGSSTYSTTGLTYATLRAKRGILTSAESIVDLTASFEFKYAFGVKENWLFQSPNDRSHHTALGVDLGAPLPWFGIYTFLSPKFIHRTHARVSQIEGSAGLVIPVVSGLTVSPYYHLLQSSEGTLCFHNPRDYVEFFTLPYGAKLSDSHHGPGAVVSYGVSDQITVEGFTYLKSSGVNTDKSTTFGMNLSYVIF